MIKSTHISKNASMSKNTSISKHLLAILAYMISTFISGWLWHLAVFADAYQALGVYRPHIGFEMGLLSMLLQGAVFSWLYSRLFAGQSVASGSVRLYALAFPLALSYAVFMVGAKHPMTSVPHFALLESGFTLLHFALCTPLIAWVHRAKLDAPVSPIKSS